MSKCPECINKRGYGHVAGCKGVDRQVEDSLNKGVYEAALKLTGLLNRHPYILSAEQAKLGAAVAEFCGASEFNPFNT